MSKRILICANPDLNYIDGSSIWAQTITLALADTGNVRVDFLARSIPSRAELYGPLQSRPSINIIAPRGGLTGRGRFTLVSMARQAVRLHEANPYDVIVVRGLDIALELLESPMTLASCWLYLTDIPQSAVDINPEQRLLMRRLAYGCQRLLCQSIGFADLWLSQVPDLDTAKIKLYTPVIPDLPVNLPALSERPLRAIYAGKFKGDWMTLEMARAWSDVRDAVSGSELVMIGDKIHSEPDRPKYAMDMRRLLENTEDLNWLGAQSRESVQKWLRQSRVGLSWRDENMNSTLEYSTKILEYGGAGCAAIVNRNALHEQMLGKNYPLFANSDEEFRNQLIKALSEPQILQQAADVLQTVAARHTFSARVDELKQWLAELPKSKDITTVLVAGHDLKFFSLLQKKLEATGQFRFLIDQWQGHNKHDAKYSRKLLAQADVIFCEWCLGNLAWYSRNKLAHQRLVARFHLQERELPYVAEANWDQIDHISYVSEFIRREGQQAFGFPYEKTSVIPNLIDENKFFPRQKAADASYTLGIIGVVPARKRLDRALDLLEVLIEHEPRYNLRVKGRHPLEYGWLLNRSDELDYYRTIFQRINANPKLRHRVTFDPPGDDINEWFSLVGFILSPSDFESFHMAIGEGVLTGTLPVIWSWDGAAEIWGNQWIVDSVHDAQKMIMKPEAVTTSITETPGLLPSAEIARRWQKLIQKDEVDDA